MERFDIPGRFRAIREAVGTDADTLDLAEWAARLLGPRCLRFSPVLDPERDPLLRTPDGFRILLDRSTLADPGKLQHDLAFAIARWALRDEADDRRFARACVLLAHAICAPAAESETRLRVNVLAVGWESSQTA